MRKSLRSCWCNFGYFVNYVKKRRSFEVILGHLRVKLRTTPKLVNLYMQIKVWIKVLRKTKFWGNWRSPKLDYSVVIVCCKMFTRKIPKVKKRHESRPTAWGLRRHFQMTIIWISKFSRLLRWPHWPWGLKNESECELIN